MERLPQELITKILCRLPVNLLLLLRCVSKLFCNIIDSPNFINEHLKRSMDTRTHRLLILHEQNLDSPPLDIYYPEDIYVTNFDDGLQEAKMLNHPYPSKICTTISGSCNGLLLLVIYDEEDLYVKRLVLWNPSTRRCKKLPFWSVDFEYGCEFGLGYDSSSDDYKVVRISWYHLPNQVSVYSLRSNSWRRLQDLPTEYKSFYDFKGCFANGALHWLFRRDMEYIIIAFDLATETFCIIPQPVKSSENSTADLSGLHVLEGSLCMSLTTNDATRMEQFELYVKENHGIGFTWSKFKYTFQGPCPKKVKVLAYSTKGNKVLLHDIDDMKIIWYDLHNKKGEMVDIDGIHWQHFDSIVCWESLVSLGDDSEFDGALNWEN